MRFETRIIRGVAKEIRRLARYFALSGIPLWYYTKQVWYLYSTLYAWVILQLVAVIVLFLEKFID